MERRGDVPMKLVDDEQGFSLIEVMLASLIGALIAGAFVTLFIAFSRTVTNQENRALSMAELRPSLEQLLIDVRQAVDVDDSGYIVEALGSNWTSTNLVIYSDRLLDAEGPERIRYYLDECSGGLCVLKREVTLADPGSGPMWSYTAAPSARAVIHDVITGGADPLFLGVDMTGGVESLSTGCDTSSPCDFDLLRLALRVDPTPGFDADSDLVVNEQVRIRNAAR